MRPTIDRRTVLAGLSALPALSLGSHRARAADTKITFLTDWFAEAEQGGFYQAKATGLYEKAGLNVDIVMGGPQVNAMQLLVSGAAQIIMGQDIQVLNSIAHGLPVLTVGTSFQSSLQGILAHDGISSLADLRGHKILIGGSARSTFWPWLKAHYGFTDDMIGVDTFNLQPFLVDETVAMQAYATSEPFEARAAGASFKFLLFADQGYPPYGNTMVTTQDFASKNQAVTQAFVRCSLEGWRDYLTNPAPGNRLIKEANPKMTDDRLAFAVAKLKALRVLDRAGDTTTAIGTVTEARWQQTRDFLVKADLLPASVDWRQAFTTRFTDGLDIRL